MPEFEITRLDDPEPWDRQLAETSDEYLAFSTFRNMGAKRTMAQTARDLGISAGRISKMAADHHWRDRVVAWDYYQEKIFQAEIAEQTREMARHHIELTEQSLIALRAPILALLDKMERDPEATMAEFGARDIAKLLKMAQDSIRAMPAILQAQRLAIGQPTGITQHTESQNLNYGDSERIGEILDVLTTAGILNAVLGAGASGEIVDAEVVEMDDDRSDTEANSLPPSTA